VKYLGHVLKAGCRAIPPNRVEAIQKLPVPKCKKELQRILGAINYVREYLPDLANKLDIFRPLLKKDAMFQWLPTHQETLDSIKDDIVKATNLYPFDESLPVTIQTDASNVGLGCCLMQRDKPVAFASRGLTETETQYPPIAKECLGIVFACKKFHYFIYGKEVKIITDSKPLVSLSDKPLAKISSSQLLRLRTQVLDYDLKVSYRPGKFMHTPDTLSRAPIPLKPEDKLWTKWFTRLLSTVWSARELRLSRRCRSATRTVAEWRGNRLAGRPRISGWRSG